MQTVTLSDRPTFYRGPDPKVPHADLDRRSGHVGEAAPMTAPTRDTGVTQQRHTGTTRPHPHHPSIPSSEHVPGQMPRSADHGNGC